MEASFFLSPLRDGRCGPMRGALPLREQVGRLGSYSPKWGGCTPHAPIGRALRPIPREFMQGWQPLHPPCGRSAPRPGGFCGAGSPSTHLQALRPAPG